MRRNPGAIQHLLPDHVHMMIAIPSKYAVFQGIGFVKGKSAIHLVRVYKERRFLLSELLAYRLSCDQQPPGAPKHQLGFDAQVSRRE